MSTYFLVTTVDADDAADAVAIARSMDEPTDVPTIEDLRSRIGTALIRYAAELKDATDFSARVEVTKAYEALIVEIVTLGNVPADS